jgi:hypothetical protein
MSVQYWLLLIFCRLVSENVMQKLVPELLSCYPSEVLCQSQAIQYLLDVKYLQCQFVPVTNKVFLVLIKIKTIFVLEFEIIFYFYRD